MNFGPVLTDSVSTTMTDETPSKCPVQHTKPSNRTEEPSLWNTVSAWWTSQPQKAPASVEEAAKHAQTPLPDQTMPLDRARVVSGIPRGSFNPHHQSSENAKNWIYPSEQQLFNAMRRKGYQVTEDSIPTVLQIHNGINERTWRQIQEWEDSNDLVLDRFVGRPRDLSPKAWFLSKVLGRYDPPFDRHDWHVRHESGVQRYVIDYYYLPPPDPSQPPIPYVDARPALDHPRAAWMQTQRFVASALPGFAAFYRRYFE